MEKGRDLCCHFSDLKILITLAWKIYYFQLFMMSYVHSFWWFVYYYHKSLKLCSLKNCNLLRLWWSLEKLFYTYTRILILLPLVQDGNKHSIDSYDSSWIPKLMVSLFLVPSFWGEYTIASMSLSGLLFFMGYRRKT